MGKPLFTGPEVLCVSTGWDGREGEPYGSVGGRSYGEQVMEWIGAALKLRDEASRVRALGECVRRFPRETLRHPEVCCYLHHLSRRRDNAAIARIMADGPRRGRPARSVEEEFTETAIVDGIIKRESCSARKAAEIARQEHPRVFGHKTERAIQNDYSRTRDVYRVACEPRWVPGDMLTDAPWQPREDRRGRR